MIFPWRTDAPVYHFPFATIGLIVVNWLVFACAFQEAADLEPYILHYGQGLQPIQWVTSNFIHGDLLHLLGNMLFLWTFGLIVEGKLGWWRFLLLYLGIGIGECAFEQSVTLGLAEGGSFGASSVVFGLMAIALVWAPKNDVTCLVFIGFRPFNWDAPVLVFAMLYIGLQVALAALAGTEISSALLHLFGIAIGLAVGVGLLKLGWVDCEGWDLFNVLRGRQHEAQSELRKTRRDDADEIPLQLDPAGSLRHLTAMAQAGHVQSVPALY
ncbi:MAG: rhomboid family intramembrane serine protease [Planctomycetaceae bacterium]|nr:rhomboid family intramembrane serine protease [Planctomycetaceae bacterium]